MTWICLVKVKVRCKDKLCSTQWVLLIIDSFILGELQKYNIDKDYARKCIEANRHNEATTTYYLLVKKYQREGKEDIIDPNSSISLEKLLRSEPKQITKNENKKDKADDIFNTLELPFFSDFEHTEDIKKDQRCNESYFGNYGAAKMNINNIWKKNNCKMISNYKNRCNISTRFTKDSKSRTSDLGIYSYVIPSSEIKSSNRSCLDFDTNNKNNEFFLRLINNKQSSYRPYEGQSKIMDSIKFQPSIFRTYEKSVVPSKPLPITKSKGKNKIVITKPKYHFIKNSESPYAVKPKLSMRTSLNTSLDSKCMVNTVRKTNGSINDKHNGRNKINFIRSSLMTQYGSTLNSQELKMSYKPIITNLKARKYGIKNFACNKSTINYS